MQIKKTTKSVTASSKKFTGKSWSEFISNLKSAGYSIDSAYTKKPEQWIVIDDKDGNSYDAEVTEYSDGNFELMEYNITKKIDACGEVKASTKISAKKQAQKHIKAAIDILATCGKDDIVAKDNIANLSVVMFDLMGQEDN